MERFLLLWDELDDLVGAARYLALNAAHGFASTGKGAVARLMGWSSVAGLPSAEALGDAPIEP